LTPRQTGLSTPALQWQPRGEDGSYRGTNWKRLSQAINASATILPGLYGGRSWPVLVEPAPVSAANSRLVLLPVDPGASDFVIPSNLLEQVRSPLVDMDFHTGSVSYNYPYGI
jgi:hypothetical protein